MFKLLDISKMKAKIKQKLLSDVDVIYEEDTFISSYDKEVVEGTVVSTSADTKSKGEDTPTSNYDKDLENKIKHKGLNNVDLEGTIKLEPEEVISKGYNNLPTDSYAETEEIIIKSDTDFVKPGLGSEQELKLENCKLFDVKIKIEESYCEEELVRFNDELSELHAYSKCKAAPQEPSEVRVKKFEKCTYETEPKHIKYVKYHMLTHKDSSEVTVHQCEICKFHTTRKNNFKYHILHDKPTLKIPMFECSQCAYKTKFKLYFRRHMLVHKNASQIKTHQCEICDFRTKWKEVIRRHKLLHKDPSEVTLYRCDICKYTTKHQQCLTNHMVTHQTSEVNIFKCVMCEYTTKYKSSLKDHMANHKNASKVLMYRCFVCEFKTRHMYSLKYHTLSTHKDIPGLSMYKCDTCSFKTKHKDNLKKHAVIHKECSSKATMYECVHTGRNIK